MSDAPDGNQMSVSDRRQEGRVRGISSSPRMTHTYIHTSTGGHTLLEGVATDGCAEWELVDTWQGPIVEHVADGCQRSVGSV